MALNKIISSEKLLSYFIDHLNLIYCAKLHIIEKLPVLAEYATFADLRNAILETASDIQKQILRMDEIYILIDASYSKKRCAGTLGLIEDVFSAISEKNDDTLLRDLSILFYMQHMESIEIASFKVLQMTAAALQNNQISQLLLENFDEAKDDRKLLLLINAKYLVN